MDVSPPSEDRHQYRTFACSACNHAFRAPVSCGNRFCSICNSGRRRRLRAKMSFIVRSVQLSPGERIRFLTLTIPRCEDLRAAAQQLIKSFRRLRQRQFWLNKVTGGFYVIEVTGRPGNWHCHLHAAISAKFLSVRQLSTQWQRVSPGRIVHIKTETPAVIIRYITKYVTKTSLDESVQPEASEALRNFRLFQPFGRWSKLATKAPKVSYSCPECNCTFFYLTSQYYDEEAGRMRDPPTEKDRERWALAASEALDKGQFWHKDCNSGAEIHN